MTNEIEAALARVGEEDVRTFERDGAVCLRGVYGERWLELIRAGIERDLESPGPYWRVQSAPGDPGFFGTDYYMWRRISELRRFALEGPGGAVAARILRSNQINYFYDGLFVKEPGTEKPSLWHQDQVYYNVDGRKVAVMWIPVDPVARENCLELIGGSHAWGKSFVPRMIKDARTLERPPAGYEELPDIEAQRERYRILSWDMEPGDCIAFHAMMLHGSRGNRSTSRRRALQTTWLGDDAVYGLRPGEVEPRIEDETYNQVKTLRPGQRLDDERIFPKVWPRAEARA